MMSLRDHIDGLHANGNLLEIEERVHWDEEAAIVASEALRHNCEALQFESTPGTVSFASGVYAGPDQLSNKHHRPWCRIGNALGLGQDCSYVELLNAVSQRKSQSIDNAVIVDPAAEEYANSDLYSLGLPTDGQSGRQLITLGVIAVEHEGTTSWAPVRGTIQRSSRLHLRAPQRFVDWCDSESSVSISLGVSAASLIATLQGWTQDRITVDVPKLAVGLSDVPVARVNERIVPASAEVRIDGKMVSVDETVAGLSATWERGCETTTIAVETEQISLRDDPIVPFTPLGSPLTDDIHLMSIVEAAALYRRVNGYWGVSPVSWVQLPVEGRLGICLVSSEILYMGFDWQLANVLFSFSEFFDKVLVLDESAEPMDLARALDDMWVKAHPGNDWIFSDSNAPAASAPMYRRDGETGSRLYISATWDPQWDEDYIAPRVTFESSFPENTRESALSRWNTLGFEQEIE